MHRTRPPQHGLHRSCRILLAVVVAACTTQARDESDAGDRERTVESRVQQDTMTVRYGDFCVSDSGPTFEYLMEVEEATTGDRSGYAIRLRRHRADRYSVEGSEAIGSFGDLMPVQDLRVDTAESSLVTFALATAHPDLRGTSLAMRFDCDSAWGIARGPYAGAPAQPVRLLRWRPARGR